MSREPSVWDDEQHTSDDQIPGTSQDMEWDAPSAPDKGAEENGVTSAAAACPFIVEGTVVESSVLASSGSSPGCHRQVLRQGLIRGWMVLTLVLVLALVEDRAPGLLGPLARLVPGLVPSNTVIITPLQSEQSTTMVITAVTGMPDRRQQQIQARFLSLSSPTWTQTVQTTGTGHSPARQAQGTLTFYNAAPYPQTVAAGTSLTGTDGVRVVTDASAILPAGNLPTVGIATVPAHTVETGPRGNIAALDVNGLCCVPGVAVKNTDPFTGGQAARDYHLVLQQDIDRVVIPISAILTQEAQTTLQTQVRSHEQLVNSAQCTPAFHSDHPAGSEAVQVTVTVAVTCLAEVYDQRRAEQLAADQLTHQAARNLGTSYVLVGTVTTVVRQVKLTDTQHGILSLLVKARGVWVYQFSDARLQHFARLVAGRDQTEAQALLMQQVGIRAVSIILAGGDGGTLPQDPRHIRILVLTTVGV